jgi:hypothetical protein
MHYSESFHTTRHGGDREAARGMAKKSGDVFSDELGGGTTRAIHKRAYILPWWIERTFVDYTPTAAVHIACPDTV